jgi:predicted nucleic acid-binding protein
LIVPDASAIIEWMLQSVRGVRVSELLLSGAERLHAPHLLDIEVTQGLRHGVAAGTIRLSRTQEALQDFLDLPIQRHPHDAILWRIWDLRDNLGAYDATYVALAEALDATLLTCDAKIRAASGHYVRVEVV